MTEENKDLEFMGSAIKWAHTEMESRNISIDAITRDLMAIAYIAGVTKGIEKAKEVQGREHV